MRKRLSVVSYLFVNWGLGITIGGALSNNPKVMTMGITGYAIFQIVNYFLREEKYDK